MKKVRRGHRVHVIIYLCIIAGLIIAEYFALSNLFQSYPYIEEIHFEKIKKPIIGTNEVIVKQDVVPRTHDVQMNAIEITYDEAQLLLKVAQAEAGNQGSDGMWLVMSVILNRVDSSDFPDSITEVVTQKYQFSTVLNGSIDKVEISPECHEALARIERGDVAPEIIGFETTKSKTLDRYFSPAFAYRDHQFYTLREE